MKIQYLVWGLVSWWMMGLASAQTVTAPRSVSVSPSKSIVEGGSFILTASASGTTPFSYQWSKDGVPVAGATTATYQRAAATLADVGAYSVVVGNAAGSAESGGVGLTIDFDQLPIITRHPFSRTVKPGSLVELIVTAAGVDLNYEWRRSGVAVPGATGSSYRFTAGSTPGASDSYVVLVRNRQGAVLSEAAVVAVDEASPLLITRHPAGQTFQVGPGFGFNLEVFTDHSSPQEGAMAYQWYKDGQAIPGATSFSFYKTDAVAGDAGRYFVIVSNSAGSATSATATLTLVPGRPPVIRDQPRSYSLTPDFPERLLSILLAYESGYPRTFQWRKDGVAIPGATEGAYVVNRSQPNAAGSYTVVVTNSVGSVTSEASVMTVDSTSPLIMYTSQGRLVPYGSNSFVEVGVDVPDATVVWRKNGLPVTGATSKRVEIPAVTDATTGRYIATVSAPGWTPRDSQPISIGYLDAGLAPVINVQPRAQTVGPGESALVSVTAAGEEPLTYQWRKDGLAVPDATDRYYSPPATLPSAGAYSVVISNRWGAVVSDVVAVNVVSPPLLALPVITTQPTSYVVFTDEDDIPLSISVAPADGLTYQWFRDGVAVPGSTSSSLLVSYRKFLTPTIAGRYKVVVTNGARSGSVSSKEALIAVVARDSGFRVSIFGWTSDSPVRAGTPVTLQASTITTASYQWRKNGVSLSAATTASLVLPSFGAGDAGTYTVQARSSLGMASSNTVVLSLQTPAPGLPVISRQPLSSMIVSTSILTLSAGVVGNPAPSLQWRKDGVPLAGATDATLTVSGASASGSYGVVATNSFGSIISDNAVVSVIGASIPVISVTLSNGALVTPGTDATLSGLLGSPRSYSYQWRKNGIDLPGATAPVLPLTNLKTSDSGTYTLVTTLLNNPNYPLVQASQPFQFTVPASTSTGVYFGTFAGGDSFALSVSPEGVGLLVGLLESRGQAVIARGFQVLGDGSFTATGGTLSRQAASFYSGPITGRISAGAVTGNLSALGLTFTGAAKPSAGPAAAVAGGYSGVALAAAPGEVHVVAAADGTLQFVAVDSAGPRSARGTVTSSGAFSVVQPQYSSTGTLGSAFSATYQPTGAAPVVFVPPAAANGAERLANVSTRSVAGSGTRTLIAGFAVTGTAAKDVLVRAVGPGLRLFGVGNSLDNPKLRLYRGSTLLAENDDWSNGSAQVQVSAATARLGAFPFAVGSADAALFMRLTPGTYTAQVTGEGTSEGVALVEVYDAATTGGEPQKLSNVSTRAEVGSGGDVLIVGVVVTGDAPKKLLVRGVGPALAGFGVSDALAAPRLQLYRGSQLLRENSGWSTGADRALIAAAATQVGAFGLPDGSKDTALLLYLAPGNYTAQITGLNATTGVALVEVYEVP